MMHKRIKVIQVLYDMSVAGAQTVVMNYLRKMKDDLDIELKVLVITPRNNSDYDKEIEENLYPVEYLDYKPYTKNIRLRPVINWFRYQKCIWRALHKEKPDILHTHQTKILPFVCLPVLFSRVPVKVHTLHSDPKALDKRYVYWAKLAFNVLKFYPICVTEQQGEKARNRYGIKEITVIHNGLDIEKYAIVVDKHVLRRSLGLTETDFVIGFVGRLERVKNIDFLLHVFREYYKINSNAKLLLIGSGQLESHIKTLINEYNISKAVLLLGQRKDVNVLYHALDLFMLTSFYESSSIVTVEAQLSGIRCVLADSIPENVVIRRDTARLSLNDPIEKWICAINGISESSADIRSDPSDFSIDKSIKKTKALYKDLLK